MMSSELDSIMNSERLAKRNGAVRYDMGVESTLHVLRHHVDAGVTFDLKIYCWLEDPFGEMVERSTLLDDMTLRRLSLDDHRSRGTVTRSTAEGYAEGLGCGEL